jgi:glycosyltransferase EpsJ
MLEKPLFSIIIPFYNVEQYVAECLDSVFEQNLSEDEYEVICVNDGSTDGSRAIVSSYLPKHANIRIIDHPHNLCLGSARNTGAKAAKGKYIWHVDSDDKIVPNCLKQIADICEGRQLDVLEFGYIGARNLPISIGEPPRTTDVVTGQEYITRYYLSNFGAICPIWRRVYRRAFLEANKIVSPPINMGEDEPFAIDVFVTAKRISFEPKDWYVHRINNQSLVGENMKDWSALKWYNASIVCAKHVSVVYQKLKHEMLADIRRAARNMVIYDILYFQKYESVMSPEAKDGFWRLCRRNFISNLYVFRYLNRGNAFCYMRKVLTD